MTSSSVIFSKREKIESSNRTRARRALQTQKSHGSFRLRGHYVSENPVGLPATGQLRRRTHARFGKIFHLVIHCVYTSRRGVSANIRASAPQVNRLLELICQVKDCGGWTESTI
jgi:hypothetical protein